MMAESKARTGEKIRNARIPGPERLATQYSTSRSRKSRLQDVIYIATLQCPRTSEADEKSGLQDYVDSLNSSTCYQHDS